MKIHQRATVARRHAKPYSTTLAYRILNPITKLIAWAMGASILVCPILYGLGV